MENLRENVKKAKISVEVFSDMGNVTIDGYITFTLKNNKKLEFLYDYSDGTLSKKDDRGTFYMLDSEPRKEVLDLVEEKLLKLIWKLEGNLSKTKKTWEGKL